MAAEEVAMQPPRINSKLRRPICVARDNWDGSKRQDQLCQRREKTNVNILFGANQNHRFLSITYKYLRNVHANHLSTKNLCIWKDIGSELYEVYSRSPQRAADKIISKSSNYVVEQSYNDEWGC